MLGGITQRSSAATTWRFDSVRTYTDAVSDSSLVAGQVAC
jgi:hypothetical protein